MLVPFFFLMSKKDVTLPTLQLLVFFALSAALGADRGGAGDAGATLGDVVPEAEARTTLALITSASKMDHFSGPGKLLVIYPYRPFWPNEIIFHQPGISLK